MSLNTRDAPPLVTVVVPVYNTERYVGETLRSVIAQTWENLEIIIVIDGSTDGSLDICRGFDDERIRIVEQENQGLAAARNTGIRESTGAYIGFIDSDDTWRPEKVARHVAHLNADPGLGVSYSYSAMMSEEGELTGLLDDLGTESTSVGDCFVQNVIGNGSNAVLRRAVFDGIEGRMQEFPPLSGFDTELKRAEDYEMWSRIAMNTQWKLGCVPELLVNYRNNPLGLSSSRDLQRAYHFLAMAKIAGYAPNRSEALRERAVSHFYWHQARVFASRKETRAGMRSVRLALRYWWEWPRTNQVLISLALMACLVLPGESYYRFYRRAERFFGRFQKRRMAKQDRNAGAESTGTSALPATAFVRAPSFYVRKKAMPNLFFLCHKHRFMYLGISKNASTSMKYCMWREESGDDAPDNPDASHRYWGWTPVKDRSIDRGNRAELARYGDYLKFTVYRDPVSRFLSAYHNRVLFSRTDHPFYTAKRLEGMGLEQFIRVAESVLKIDNPLHIDEHLRPQAWCFEPSDVDFIVPIEHLQAFLQAKFGIVDDRRANKTDLPRIRPTGEQTRKIRELYACDYRIEPNWSP